MVIVTARLVEAAAAVADGAGVAEEPADALAEPATAVADGLAVSPTGLAADVALDCWLLLAKTRETIADAGICSMVAKPSATCAVTLPCTTAITAQLPVTVRPWCTELGC